MNWRACREELLKIASHQPKPVGRWLYQEIDGLCPVHGTVMRLRQDGSTYCPLDEPKAGKITKR